MGAFSDIDTSDMEQSKDVIGGEYTKNTGIYKAIITAAYRTVSQGGAVGVGLIMKLEDDTEYRETLWVTNKEGKAYYVHKTTGKKSPLKGFSMIDDLCWIVTEKPLNAQNTEEKQVKIYNSATQKEEPTLVPVLTDLVGKTVLVALIKERTNKTQKQGNEYVPIAEERFINYIDKFFHPELKCTYPEARDNLEKGAFYEAWLKKYVKDGNPVTVDKYEEVTAGTSSTPMAAGANHKAGTSLFGNK